MSTNHCPETPTIGPELLALVAISMKTIELHLTDSDPKIALRAVAELTKLLGVCARNGIPIESGTSAPQSPAASTPVPPAPPASVSEAVTSRVAQAVANLAAEMGEEFDNAFEDILEDEDDFEDDEEEKTSPMIVPTFTREPDVVLPTKAPRNPLRSPIVTTVPDARTVLVDRPDLPLLGKPIRLTDCLKMPDFPRPERPPTDSR